MVSFGSAYFLLHMNGKLSGQYLMYYPLAEHTLNEALSEESVKSNEEPSSQTTLLLVPELLVR